MRNKPRLGRGIALGAVLTGVLATSVSAATTQVEATDDKTFSPGVRTSAVGGSVHWFGTTGSAEEHSVHQNAAIFDSGEPAAGLDYTRVFSAGTFAYHCEKHGLGMAGAVSVPPQVLSSPAGLPFTVKWATAATNTGTRFDVHYRVGTGAWKLWANNTSARSKVFGSRAKPVRLVKNRVYSFRVRSGTATATVNSGYSPVQSFRVR